MFLLNIIQAKYFPFLLLVIFGFFSMVLCGFQAQFYLDPHHAGLILSNAKDIHNGLIPYKEIFLQYGYLGALINSLLFKLNFGNIYSLLILTNLFYISGLFGLYFLSKNLLNSKFKAFIIFILALLVHPYSTIPWPNYLAFPFIVFSIYLLVLFFDKKNFFYLILSGFLSGLAFLIRETYIYSYFIFLIALLIFDIFQYGGNYRKYLKKFIFLFIGFLIPLIFFFSYLCLLNVFEIWLNYFINIPILYAKINFPHISSFESVFRFFSRVLNASIKLDFRWLIYMLIFLANLYFLCIYIVQIYKNKFEYTNNKFLIIICICFAMIIASLHIPEIFRLTTGSIIGLICLIKLFQHRSIILIFAFFFIFALSWTLFNGNSGNLFLPSKHTIENSVDNKIIPFFKFSKWPQENISFYQEFSNSMESAMIYDCNIKYHVNYSMDAFLSVLSPFKYYQIAPYGMWDVWASLRNDIDTKSKIKNDSDLIIFDTVPNSDLSSYSPPNNFYISKILDIPPAIFIPPNHKLILLMPIKCRL